MSGECAREMTREECLDEMLRLRRVCENLADVVADERGARRIAEGREKLRRRELEECGVAAAGSQPKAAYYSSEAGRVHELYSTLRKVRERGASARQDLTNLLALIRSMTTGCWRTQKDMVAGEIQGILTRLPNVYEVRGADYVPTLPGEPKSYGGGGSVTLSRKETPCP